MTDHPTVDELFDLSSKVAIVTGGTGALGSRMADALAEAGANVVVASRSSESCKDKATALSAEHAEALGQSVDVTDPESVEELVRIVEDHFGRIDILVNNAYSGSLASFESMAVDEWESAIDTALTGTFLMSRAVRESIAEDGGGSIVNVGSIYGVVSPDHRIYGRAGNASPPNYGPAKAGVIQFTRWLATYLASEGVRVNCISPGGFYNEERAERDPYYEEDFVANYRHRTPLGRMGEPGDLKGAVVFLASDASRWITGQNLIVDGGFTVW